MCNLYSGYTHGHPFALWRDCAEEVADGALRYRPLVNEESFKGAVAMASYALYPPAERLSALFGLLGGHMLDGGPGAVTG